MGYFSQIKDAMVFAFNLPAIVELGTATGFDFELIDQGGLGHEKLTQARNQLFGMVAQHPDVLTGVRPNGLEDTPQFKIDIDQGESSRRWASPSATLTPRWAQPGAEASVNDFIDRGRVKKVYIMSEAKYRMLPEDIGKWYVRGSDGQMVPFSAFLDLALGIRFAASGTLQRSAVTGNPRSGRARQKVPVRRWR